MLVVTVEPLTAQSPPRRLAPVIVVDADGDTVRLPRAARRVVSLVPSVTEFLVAIGARSQLVGRTRFDTATALRAVPSVGGGIDPDLERLTSLRPDLVVSDAARTSPLRTTLATLGIPVLSVRTGDTTAAFVTLGRLGAVVGRPTAAAAVATRLRGDFAALAALPSPPVRPRALFVVWLRPPMGAGPRAFVTQLLSLAGADGVLDDVVSDWPRFSLEALRQRDPDVVVLPVGEPGGPTRAALEREPGWRGLPAVRRGRVLEVPADLVARPGPRMGEAARLLRARLAALPASNAPAP